MAAVRYVARVITISMLTLTTMILTAFSPVLAAGISDYHFAIHEGMVSIDGYNGSDTMLSLPAQAPELGAITAIWDNAFQERGLEYAFFPAGIVYIGKSAFAGNQLYSVNFASTPHLAERAFERNRIISCDLPDGSIVEAWAFADNRMEAISFFGKATLGSEAFSGNQLVELDLSGVTLQGSGIFQNNALERVILPDEVPELSALTALLSGNRLTNINLPTSWTTVPDFMLAHNRLGSLPDLSHVSQIGKGAFNDNLLPNEQAFIRDKQDSRTLISYGGAKKQLVRLPEDITVLDDSSMQGCRLESLTLPDGLQAIGQGALQDNHLKTVEIPASVTTIGSDALAGNSNLSAIYLNGRQNLDGMELGDNWNGGAAVFFGEAPAGELEPFHQQVTVGGFIEPITTLDVEVPVKAIFAINEQRNFISSDFSIRNNSPIPVYVDALSCTATNGTTARVVSPDTHSEAEWDNLNAAQTQSQIALALQVNPDSDLLDDWPDGPCWFESEDWQLSQRLGLLRSGYGQEVPPALSLSFKAKYGKTWSDIQKIEYELVLQIQAA